MHLLAESSDLLRMLELFHGSGLPVTPVDFLRASRAALGSSSHSSWTGDPKKMHFEKTITAEDVRTVFDIFDLGRRWYYKPEGV